MHHSPNKLFRNADSVWISDNFKEFFLDKYTELRMPHRAKVAHSELQNIPGPAPELIFSDPNLFLEDLAQLIQNQLHGEDGPLLNDSSANYFFVKDNEGKLYNVLVRWEHAQKLWRCGAYLQNELHLPQIRIFHPAQPPIPNPHKTAN